MKKIYLLIIALSFILISPSNLKANDLAEQLKGRILLQVEEHGEAWYVNPDTKKRHFLGRPDDAFNLMRQLGMGVSEADYYSFNNYAPKRLSGKILLRVHANGEAYYVNPVDLKMYFLGRPADAFNVMRTLGLGISNSNLARINELGQSQGTNIVSLDDTWNLYTNYDLGFKIRYPKMSFNYSVNFIRNDNVIYIRPGDPHSMAIENWDKPAHERIKGIDWAMLIEEVKNEYELNSFIKKVYGDSCSFKNNYNKVNGAYIISIVGDNCFAHMSNPVVRYDANLNKVATWTLGHDPKFWIDMIGVDSVMINSFQFIE
jgi:hypothetical protein